MYNKTQFEIVNFLHPYVPSTYVWYLHVVNSKILEMILALVSELPVGNGVVVLFLHIKRRY
jgi:hypothetical protein